ncbi:hypothetical protein N7450_011636 [Penicillium hetheringtonii]|uniref:Uncharacterized protein n=1 Tax=Penicillium hetheringtonii TaxID=911720 RepID=A0AAD6GNG4_9EURO|nr:hypothetical protein N7450_011636 [Penicillium hetheringtonii]
MVSQASKDYISAQHFALIYIDQYGQMNREFSPSISHYRDTILSPQVITEFPEAVLEGGPQESSLEFVSTQLCPGHLMNYGPCESRFRKEV